MTEVRRTIDSSSNLAVLGGMKAKNNGRYNGNGRHWATPPEIFDPLHAEFDFTLDPCCSTETAKCPTFFTEAENGLEQSWAGHRVFMNPPYGREIYPWTKKARMEAAAGALVVGLLPASCDLAWWHEDIVGYAEVRYLRGRVRFLTGGAYRASGFFASVIVIWRPARQSPHLLADIRDVVEIADRNEFAPQISRVKAWLDTGATLAIPPHERGTTS
jgi:phage N-6-adenine-methyltransferase